MDSKYVTGACDTKGPWRPAHALVLIDTTGSQPSVHSASERENGSFGREEPVLQVPGEGWLFV